MAPVVYEPSFWDCAKAAFLFRWNLLILGAGLGAGFILGRPDVIGPAVLAAELGYVTLLARHPRFQKAVAARRHAEANLQSQGSVEQVQQRIVAALSENERARFDALKGRCVRLCEITRGLHSPAGEVAPLEDVRLQGVDRLLWTYLKLLYTRQMMQRFFDATDVPALDREREGLRKRLEALGPAEKDSPHQAEVRRSLEDNLETLRLRQENYGKARDNYDFVELELNRLENKINGILESAVNRRDPGFITSQVDTIAGSMSQTERTMSELQFLTGLEGKEDSAPAIVSREIQ